MSQRTCKMVIMGSMPETRGGNIAASTQLNSAHCEKVKGGELGVYKTDLPRKGSFPMQSGL